MPSSCSTIGCCSYFIFNHLHAIINLQEGLAKIGLVVVASPASGLTERLQRDVPKWGKAVKDSGAVAD